MPQKQTNYESEIYPAAHEYVGLGFNNIQVHGEFVHNQDYVETPPAGQNLAGFPEAAMIWPGGIRKPISGFDG